EGRESHEDGVNVFADLLGNDLSTEEFNAAAHTAKLQATGLVPSWTPSRSGTLVEEPESYERDSSLDISESDDSSEITCEIPDPSVLNRQGTLDSDPWKLSPEEVVRLLISEFGAVAPEGEEEKLILEMDGALVKDVSIIGEECVIHLTTHRLTFHASLLSARPDNKRGIIKSGPVTIDRKGWRSKRRLWMELSHDMICSYPSSKGSDRIRPR
ncbi:hypothetical protein R3P38DRAFT_3444315, partial [Favolaschia claudopus]